MIVPDIQHYNDYCQYFRDFLENNRKKDSKFSHRYFARKLGCQASFFADLAGGRRKLSLSRALRFAKFCQFDKRDTRRLVLLALKDSNDSVVRSYIEQQLAEPNCRADF